MTPDEVRAAWQRDRQERDQLWHRTVEALTAAARRASEQPGVQREPADFADFLASALAAVAANLGSTAAVTAGRPDSWESSLIAQLIEGTLGYTPAMSDLLSRRTEPIKIPLNVAQLVEDSGAIPTIYEAEDALPPGADATQLEALHAQYRAAYERYATAFGAAALAYAHTLEGLAVEHVVGEAPTIRVPVEVLTETQPGDQAWSSPIQNPEEFEGDEVVWRIWEGARERAGLPTLELNVTPDGNSA